MVESAAPLSVNDFGRRYHRRGPWAVRHLTFIVPEGSVTALVGPNGAGKSTLIRGCLGFEPPDEGDVAIEGRDIRREATTALRHVGYVPQVPALYRSFTVEDHFCLAAVARPSFDRGLAARLLDAAMVDRKRKIRELSGGEQAQVSLALAVATRASLLLLDEPLASLDPLARRDFLGALLRQVRQDGSTVVLSSHLVKDIEQVCDRILLLSQGVLALDASLEEATTQFRVVAADDAHNGQVVGRFASPRGEEVALVRGTKAGHPPSLEDLVLGHLAASRHV